MHGRCAALLHGHRQEVDQVLEPGRESGACGAALLDVFQGQQHVLQNVALVAQVHRHPIGREDVPIVVVPYSKPSIENILLEDPSVVAHQHGAKQFVVGIEGLLVVGFHRHVVLEEVRSSTTCCNLGCQLALALIKASHHRLSVELCRTPGTDFAQHHVCKDWPSGLGLSRHGYRTLVLVADAARAALSGCAVVAAIAMPADVPAVVFAVTVADAALAGVAVVGLSPLVWAVPLV